MPHPLFRLVYCSHATTRVDVPDLIVRAARYNAGVEVCGALAVEGDQFVQAIEGRQDEVEALFAIIARDPRHEIVAVLERRLVERASFPESPMALVGRTPSGGALLGRLMEGEDGRPRDVVWLIDAMRRALEQDLLNEIATQEAEARREAAAGERRGFGADGRGAGGCEERVDLTPVSAAAPVAQVAPAAAASELAGAQIAALSRSQGLLQLDMDGTIRHANDVILAILGYEAQDIVGQPHARLLEPGREGDAADASFWRELAAGRSQTGEFRRRGKDGRPVWLQAVYAPVEGEDGRPVAIMCLASDVSAAVRARADFQWQIAAIHKSHAVISFDMHGLILDANESFLEASGYALDEIVGRHHRMFVEPAYAHSFEYAAFWGGLAKGRHQAGGYKRVGKDGRELWLQATYNPIFDADGRPVRVVKYATVVTEERLRQAEHQGQIAAIHKAQCVVSFDLEGHVLDANDNFLAVMGYRLGEVRGRHHMVFVEPRYAESADYAAFWERLAAGEHHSGEYKRLGRDGREVWLRATYNPIFDMSGRPFRVMKYATDVTAEKLAQADFEGQIAAIRKSQGVISFALDGTILDVNENFLTTLGYELDEVRGRPHAMLVEPDYAASAEYRSFWATLRAGEFLSGMFKRVGRDGRAIWIQASYNPILDLNGRPIKIVKYATDVTSNVALAEAFEDAQRQAQHDPATSLPNRTRLAAFLTSALAHPSAQLAVLYLDLDRFKPVNDTYGHALGDKVLGGFADRLRRLLGPDQLAARVGGDEFVVAAPGLCGEQAAALSQRLIDAVAEPFLYESEKIHIGVSIGIALAPADGSTADELLRAADAALYRSKEEGRGTFSFHADDLNHKITAYRSLVADIRRAIAAEEFFIEFQPRFRAATDEVASVEALVRWAHPERGRIAPAEFIPAAEKSGLIAPLGEWVLRRACEEAARWPEIGVSVNVSPVQFREPRLVEMVAATLAATRLRPDRLEIEITEGVLLENADRAKMTLEALKRLGVKLAMDDFGTGYSSLSTLRTYPFDVIKIDRQFVSDLDKRSGGREVVRAILGLGRALGLSVTAEGVETPDQAAMLIEDACDELQGFLLARPLPAEGVDELMGRGRRLAVA